jgi:hypothetical protein
MYTHSWIMYSIVHVLVVLLRMHAYESVSPIFYVHAHMYIDTPCTYVTGLGRVGCRAACMGNGNIYRPIWYILLNIIE